MLGIDSSFICPKLAIVSNARPVAQGKRKLGEERWQTIAKETSSLLKDGFITEVHYTIWLSNVVMVKKPLDKWRMCVDFTDLNKACLKNSYPLPNIDRFVDGASGYRYLSFLDAYLGYNQILMYSNDEENIAFITEDVNYCYRVMLFELKNVGATWYDWIAMAQMNQKGGWIG